MDFGRSGSLKRLLGETTLRAPVDHAKTARRVGNGDVVGDRELGNERKLLEDADDAGAIGGGGKSKATSAPSSTIRPESGATTPDRILMRVDLPAPFSPRMA